MAECNYRNPAFDCGVPSELWDGIIGKAEAAEAEIGITKVNGGKKCVYWCMEMQMRISA